MVINQHLTNDSTVYQKFSHSKGENVCLSNAIFKYESFLFFLVYTSIIQIIKCTRWLHIHPSYASYIDGGKDHSQQIIVWFIPKLKPYVFLLAYKVFWEFLSIFALLDTQNSYQKKNQSSLKVTLYCGWSTNSSQS